MRRADLLRRHGHIFRLVIIRKALLRSQQLALRHAGAGRAMGLQQWEAWRQEEGKGRHAGAKVSSRAAAETLL